MLTIKANIKTCVNDMTQQGKQALYEKYFSAGFEGDTFELKVYLDKETFKVFHLYIDKVYSSVKSKDCINAILTADNGCFGKEKLLDLDFTITQHMTVLAGILCALHVCGDYIKFAFQPISLESEENHNA